MKGTKQFLQQTISPLQHNNTLSSLAIRLVLSALVVGMIGVAGTALAWLSQAPSIPNSTDNVTWPDVSIDNTGTVHAVWLHSADGNFGKGTLMYDRGVMQASGDVAWEYPQILSSIKARSATPRVETDSNGTVHVAFAGEDLLIHHIYNASRGEQGQWGDEVAARPTDDFFDIDLALDSEGVPYIAWAEGLGNGNSRIRLVHKASWEWSLPYEVTSPWVYLARSCEMAINGSGSTAQIHIVYEFFASKNAKIHVGYAQGNTYSGFGTADFTALFGFDQGDSAAIARDPVSGRLFAGFIAGSVDDDYKLYLTTSGDGGGVWAAPAMLRVQAGVWPFRERFVAANDVLHIVAEQKYWNGSGFRMILIYYQTYDAQAQEYSVPLLISNEWELGGAPRISIGGPGKAAVWIGNNINSVRYNTDLGGSSDKPTPTPTPSGIYGRIRINNDDDATTSNDVKVTIFLDNKVADEYRLWNMGESEPTEYRAMLSLEAPGKDTVDWTLPPPTASGERHPCSQPVVYGRMRSTIDTTLAPSKTMTDSILLDPGVDASVTVQNPQDADPGYTADGAYMLDVQTTTDGECSGLDKVLLDGQTVPHNGQSATAQLTIPDVITGTHTMTVTVQDGAGYAQQYVRSITLDNESPVVTGTGTLSATNQDDQVIEETDSTQVNLRFSDVGISDAIYGTMPGEDKPFWGVALANSRESIPVTDTARLDTLVWHNVAVGEAIANTEVITQPTYTFTVPDWNIHDGLTRNDWSIGDHTIYARVLDGAGNAAPHVFTTHVWLNTFAYYEVFLPVVRR